MLMHARNYKYQVAYCIRLPCSRCRKVAPPILKATFPLVLLFLCQLILLRCRIRYYPSLTIEIGIRSWEIFQSRSLILVLVGMIE